MSLCLPILPAHWHCFTVHSLHMRRTVGQLLPYLTSDEVLMDCKTIQSKRLRFDHILMTPLDWPCSFRVEYYIEAHVEHEDIVDDEQDHSWLWLC